MGWATSRLREPQRGRHNIVGLNCRVAVCALKRIGILLQDLPVHKPKALPD